MNAILIDDEKLSLDYLQYQLADMPELQVIGAYTDPITGAEAILNSDVQIAFLDIEIPELNGIQLAEQLLERKPGLHVVFITAYNSYAIQAFELNALDYILKPASRKRLTKTLSRIKNDRELEKAASSSSAYPRLIIRLLQQITFERDGHPLPALRWRTAKTQQLFLYLLHYRDQFVDKAAIMELLWPELDTHKASQQLYSAIYYIRKTLAPISQNLTIHSAKEAYILRTEQTKIDVDQFDQFVHNNLALDATTIQAYEQFLQLMNGEYLQGYDYVWAEEERRRRQLIWVQNACKVASWHYLNGSLEQALSLSMDIVRRYPLEEEARFIHLQILAAMHRSRDVQLQYAELCELMQKELQLQPHASIREWYVQWKNAAAIKE